MRTEVLEERQVRAWQGELHITLDCPTSALARELATALGPVALVEQKCSVTRPEFDLPSWLDAGFDSGVKAYVFKLTDEVEQDLRDLTRYAAQESLPTATPSLSDIRQVVRRVLTMLRAPASLTAMRVLNARTNPLPLLLNCPACGERHIDEGLFATEPHKTHACQFCGLVWKPALVPTVGVRFLPGCGPPG